MIRRSLTRVIFSLSVASCMSFNFAEAVEGSFPTGYAARQLGMGGTAVANPQESLVLAVNPAGISFLEDRFDAALQWFSPRRGYRYSGNPPAIPRDHVISQRDDFFIPGLGFNKHWDACNSFGVGLYGRGGLNTTYPRANPIFGGGNTHQIMELDYMQMLIAPTYSRAFGENQAIGVSLVLGAQRLRIKGLQGFEAFSSSPEHVSNNGFDWAEGIGARIGWMGEVFCGVTFGVAYATRVYMTPFRKYRGLLAEHGRLDIPAEFLAGFSWQITDSLLIAFDYQFIFFGDVKALGHRISRLAPGNLGTNEGAGFGWQNTGFYKVGVNYCISPTWEVRAGYTFGEKIPYPSSQVDANIMAPVDTRHHISLGGTYHMDWCNQFDVAYIYGVLGHRKGESVVGLGRVKERVYQHALIIQYSYAL